MPSSPPRRCPTCLQEVKGRCTTCNWSGSRYKSGGLSTSDTRWRRVRAQRLKIEPQCRECGEVASQVDHLDSTDYSDDSGTGASWLSVHMTRSLCTPHHHLRTAMQGVEARRRS
jgi:5-methylcytosine-specific restriction endonuclease McrA